MHDGFSLIGTKYAPKAELIVTKYAPKAELIVTKYIPEGQKAYNNAHSAAKMSLRVALTITEFGLTKLLPVKAQVPYDIYSGSHFDTIPTSPAGWFGYSMVAPEPLH